MVKSKKVKVPSVFDKPVKKVDDTLSYISELEATEKKNNEVLKLQKLLELRASKINIHTGFEIINRDHVTLALDLQKHRKPQWSCSRWHFAVLHINSLIHPETTSEKCSDHIQKWYDEHQEDIIGSITHVYNMTHEGFYGVRIHVPEIGDFVTTLMDGGNLSLQSNKNKIYRYVGPRFRIAEPVEVILHAYISVGD